MARPSRCRRICIEPAYDSFAPEGISCGEQVILTVDEYEVIRMIDLEKLTHEQCARQMDISRTTVTEAYEAAREKVADSIVHGKQLLIEGGNYRLCDGSAIHFCQRKCRKHCGKTDGTKQDVQMKGAGEMRIAVTFDTLICGGIGYGAQVALAEAGIRLYGGVTGNADDAVRAFLAGDLAYDPEVQCDHHGHGHEEGHCQGHCGENKHGCAGN